MKNNITKKRRSTESSSSSSSSSSPSSMATNNNNNTHMTLPQEIIKNILLRLPIKSLKRFESVSKSFYSLITSQTFITSHLNRFPSSYIIVHRFHNPTASAFSISALDTSVLDTNRRNLFLREVQVPFLNCLIRYPKIVGSCNGLLCLDISTCYGSGFVLWNLAIKQFVFLVRPLLTHAIGPIWMVATGFGFNQQTNDYKVVRIVNFHRDHSDGSDHFVIRAEVYSWNTGSWKVLDSTMVQEKIGPFVVNEGQNAVFSNGSLNWLANGFGNLGPKKCIISFDLGTEEFRRVGTPDYSASICTKIINFKDSLLLAYYPAANVYPGYGRSINRMELLALESYGADKQWTKIHTLDLTYSTMGTPICFHNDTELVLKRTSQSSTSLSFWNPINQSIKTLPICCNSDFTCEFFSYVESLVPVSNSGNELQQLVEEAETQE